MIRLVAADDLLLLGLAAGVIVVPDDLHLGVVGLGAGVGEEHLAHLDRGHLDQLLGKVDSDLVRPVGEALDVGQAQHLLVGDLGEALLAEAERGAPEAGHALDVFLPLVVIDIDALALVHNEGAVLLVHLGVGERVQVVCNVARGGRIGCKLGAVGRCHDARLIGFGAFPEER